MSEADDGSDCSCSYFLPDRFIIAVALRLNVPSECLKLISAVIVALASSMPALKQYFQFRARRSRARHVGTQKGGR